MLKNLLLLISFILFLINFVAGQENENRKSPVLLDEYGLLNVSAEIVRLDNYAVMLQSDPTAKAFVIHYRSHYQLPVAGVRHLKGIENYLLTRFPLAPKRIVLVDGGALECQKSEMMRKYKFPASRIQVVNGVHRKQRAVELWILPLGEHSPVPTPDSFPNFRKK